MPPLLCPPPNIVDQTFPRSVGELHLVRRALVQILQLLGQDKCVLLLTQTLRTFIVQLDENFNWNRAAEYPHLPVIYDILSRLGLQQHGVQTVDVSKANPFSPHPLPTGCLANEFGIRWSEEVGRLWVLHSRHCTPGKFFIGIACASAFAGEGSGAYENPEGLPVFPLVGPEELESLEDSSEWELPADLHQRAVSFDDAYKHVKVLGGEVQKPAASSHYQVRFVGKRSWTLDRNVQRIPHHFLKELESITGQPVQVIKYVLLFGEWPKRKSRIPFQAG
jgi:hypothetical protein